jgi:hypothetical protein
MNLKPETIEAIKTNLTLWLASAIRGGLVAAVAWLSSAHPGVAKALAIPDAALPWIATVAAVAAVSGVSTWLTHRRHSEAVTAAFRDGIAAAERVAAEKGQGVR